MRPPYRQRCSSMSGCVASGWRRCRPARASTGCASIPPAAIWPRATRSSPRTPNSARRFTPTTSCSTRASFHHARLPSHVADAPGFVANLGRHLFGAGVALVNAERRQPCADGRRLDRLLDRLDQRLPCAFWNTRRCEEAEPDTKQLLLVAQLRHRRNVGEIGDLVRVENGAEGRALS